MQLLAIILSYNSLTNCNCYHRSKLVLEWDARDGRLKAKVLPETKTKMQVNRNTSEKANGRKLG